MNTDQDQDQDQDLYRDSLIEQLRRQPEESDSSEFPPSDAVASVSPE